MQILLDNIIHENKDKLDILRQIEHPKMGWFSVYTPEEIIHAADIVPFRITGDLASASAKSRALLFANLCPYILSCMEEGIHGEYDFLDSVVMVNTCDARRRLYDAWRMYLKTSFVYIIDLPKIINPESKKYFQNQILQFKKAIENNFKCKISDKSLKESILLYNKTRSLLNQLFELRKRKNPPIKGSEAMAIVRVSMSGDRKDFNEKLVNLLQKLQPLPEKPIKKTKRILITGSYFDQLSLMRMIERLGAIIVCEDLSNGIKYFEGSVDINKEPIEALAEYYLAKSPCARMADSETRSRNILRLVKDYNVDAVIYFALKFCDSNLIDFPYQRNKLNEDRIPVLLIEGERSLINLSQLKTRIEAFLEINTHYGVGAGDDEKI